MLIRNSTGVSDIRFAGIFQYMLAVVADIVLLPITVVSAPGLWLVRRIGMQRLPMCRGALHVIGLLPIRRHYYEPYVDSDRLKLSLSAERFLPGIDWNEQGQLSLLAEFGRSAELGFFVQPRSDRLQFRLNNGSFESGDAEYLYQFIRHKKPRRIYEIGSGNSTMLAREAIRRNMEENSDYVCRHVCIEPFEAAWLEDSGVETIRSGVEDVALDLFEELQAGDLLFIDSSHVIRPQSDVLKEYLEILPILKRGVLVHVHDIFSPRDYPADWVVKRGWLWNEQYLVEAMLSAGTSPAGISKSPTRGRVKIPHLTAAGRGMITRFDDPWQGVRRIP